MWIQRSISSQLKASVLSRPAVVVTGARQVGKTSLIEKLFPDYNSVTLDLPSEAEQAETDPAAFLKRHPAPLIIDEVQYAPKLFRHLKTVLDKNRMLNGRYILTGSQKFQLMKSVTESLAGRADLFDLETLSYAEIQAHDPSIDVVEAMWRGGFPELYAQSGLNHSRYFQSYVGSYLERDVRALANINDLRDFERFVRACALRNGQILNKAELARDIGISPTTANSWLSILQASNQIVLLEPWFSNKTKSLVKSPKLYFMDTGLLCFLLNLSTPAAAAGSPFVGAIWEAFVYGQIRRQLSLENGTRSIFFWSDRVREVDFLLDHGGKIRLAEAKWAELPTAKTIEGIQYALGRTKHPEVRPHLVVCRVPNPFELAPGIIAAGVTPMLDVL